MKRRLITLAAGGLPLALTLGLFTHSSWAQTYPTQSIRLISPFPAGSGPDVVARIIGEKLSTNWKQPFVVDAKPGANGFIALGAAKLAPATGHDLLLADVGHMAISTSLFKKLPYEAKADFMPVGGVYRTSFFIVVGANSPYKIAKDLLAAAVATPGKMTYGSNSVGGPLHLGAAQVEAASSTKMLHVPFKEISQLYTAVSTGEVDWAMGSIASAGALMRAGKLRFLAIADDARAPSLPAVPTLEEAGGPKGVKARTWVGMFAPKATPTAVIDTLNKALNDALKQPDVIEKFANFGFVPYPITPAALASLVDSDTVVYADMVKRTGASVD